MSKHHPASPAAVIGFLLQHREMLWDLVKRDLEAGIIRAKKV